MKTLTGAQLYNICKNNKFILARYYRDNDLIGINCKIHKLKRFKDQETNQARSNYISWKACSFMEYISNKTGFIKTN